MQPYDGRIRVKRVAFLSLRPGDLVLHNYTYENKKGRIVSGRRFGIVLSSKRTRNGHFLSTQNNTLLNLLLLESISEQLFTSVVNILYKNRKKCEYWTPAILQAFFGKENLRTFDWAKTSNIISVDIYNA